MAQDATDAQNEACDDARSGTYNTNAFQNDSALRDIYRKEYERRQEEEKARRGW